MGEEKRAREEEKQKKKEAKAKRKTVYKEAVEGEGGSVGAREVKPAEKFLPRNANQMWTAEDLIELARLIKKIPGGRLERWERIAEAMERTPEEVTKMAFDFSVNHFFSGDQDGGRDQEQSEHSAKEAGNDRKGGDETNRRRLSRSRNRWG